MYAHCVNFGNMNVADYAIIIREQGETIHCVIISVIVARIFRTYIISSFLSSKYEYPGCKIRS